MLHYTNALKFIGILNMVMNIRRSHDQPSYIDNENPISLQMVL